MVLFRALRRQTKHANRIISISKLTCGSKNQLDNLQQGIWRFMALSSSTASQKSRSLRMGKVLGSAWLRMAPPAISRCKASLIRPIAYRMLLIPKHGISIQKLLRQPRRVLLNICFRMFPKFIK